MKMNACGICFPFPDDDGVEPQIADSASSVGPEFDTTKNSRKNKQDSNSILLNASNSVEEEEDDEEDEKLMGPFLDAIRENSNETKSSSTEEEHEQQPSAKKQQKTVQLLDQLETPISLVNVQSTTASQKNTKHVDPSIRHLSPAKLQPEQQKSREGGNETRDGASAGSNSTNEKLLRTKSDPPAETLGGGSNASVNSRGSKASNLKTGKYSTPKSILTPSSKKSPATPSSSTSAQTVAPTTPFQMLAAANAAKNNAIEDDYAQHELKTLNYLEERDFDKDPSELYIHLMKKDWKKALTRILEYPKEVCSWIFRKEVDGVTVRWRLLPIHAAIIFVAPESIIDGLLLSFPDAVLARDDQGMLPIHLAVRMGATQGVIYKLLRVNPETIHMKDKKGRTPRDLAENSRGSLREQYVAILQNAPKTARQVRDEIIMEQQSLFEQALQVVKKEHLQDIEKVHRESLAQKIQLNAQIEVLQTELKKEHEKYSILEASKTDVEERLQLKVQSELGVLKQIEELEQKVQDGVKAKETLENQLEQMKAEKDVIEKALDVSELNHNATRSAATEKEVQLNDQFESLIAERNEFAERVETLEKLLQERTESEQALAWQVSALAEKLGGGFGSTGDAGTGGGGSTCGASILSDDDMYYNAGLGLEGSQHGMLSSAVPTTHADVQAGAGIDASALGDEEEGPSSATRGLGASGHTTALSSAQEQALRNLEKERDELKTTVNKLSIKLYKVVGFLDEMVQEQEAIVKEAMKRDTDDIDIDENATLDTKSKEDGTLESEFGITRTKDDNIPSTTKGNIEQILDAVPASDRKKLVDNVSGMKTQIMGVIDSVIETMPKSSHNDDEFNDDDALVVGSYDGDDTYTFHDNTTVADESVTGDKNKSLRLKVFSP